MIPVAERRLRIAQHFSAGSASVSTGSGSDRIDNQRWMVIRLAPSRSAQRTIEFSPAFQGREEIG